MPAKATPANCVTVVRPQTAASTDPGTQSHHPAAPDRPNQAQKGLLLSLSCRQHLQGQPRSFCRSDQLIECNSRNCSCADPVIRCRRQLLHFDPARRARHGRFVSGPECVCSCNGPVRVRLTGGFGLVDGRADGSRLWCSQQALVS